MKASLSSKLGARAKRAAMLDADREVTALLETAPAADVERLTDELCALGARVRDVKEMRLFTIAVPASRLEAVARIDAVVHVELATPLRANALD